MVSAPNQPVLLVEDSAEDYEMMVRSLQAAGLQNPIRQCLDGEDALDYLHQRGAYGNPSTAPRPGIIILDLNLPGTDGREVLLEVKQDQVLKRIPVIVLTTSSDERDIDACYAMGANSYIKKPLDFDSFKGAMARLMDYWFGVSFIPKVEG